LTAIPSATLASVAGIAELLEILGSIINGFALPLKVATHAISL